MDLPLFIHSLVEGHVCVFHFGTMTNQAAMNLYVQVFGRMLSFPLGKLPRSEMALSSGRCVFNILRIAGYVYQLLLKEKLQQQFL